MELAISRGPSRGHWPHRESSWQIARLCFSVPAVTSGATLRLVYWARPLLYAPVPYTRRLANFALQLRSYDRSIVVLVGIVSGDCGLKRVARDNSLVSRAEVRTVKIPHRSLNLS